MISTRDIKRKIKTIQNIGQMCRAMKTVSLVKLQKAEMRLSAARPYRATMEKALARLLNALGEDYFPGGGADGLIIITSDKGLCGGYNAGLIRRSQQEMQEMGGMKDLPLITLGKKGDRFFRRRGGKIIDSLSPLGSEVAFAPLSRLADRLLLQLKSGELSSLRAVYGRFLRGTRSEVVVEEIFPPPMREDNGHDEDVIFEPPAEVLAELLLKHYLRSALFGVVMESLASEHGARVAAMTAASENADEMIRALTMTYNKARQAAITSELTEIVSSAEALG
jgi:F-type H+-transporting ATPase subunit gamma